MATPATGQETTGRVTLSAIALQPQARARLKVHPSLRVIGVILAEGARGDDPASRRLVTLFEGPSEEALVLEAVASGHEVVTGGDATFPFDSGQLHETAGLYLGFLRLIGRWEVAVPGTEPGTWDTVAGQDIDYEVPVSAEHLDRPTACVALQGEDHHYQAAISRACDAEPDDSDAVE